MTNPCSVYDFRYSADSIDRDDIIKWCQKFSKQYVFQLEKGDTGYLHFQGRFNLAKKRRKVELLKLFDNPPNYLEPTHPEEGGKIRFTYVTKADTRVEGPWSNETEFKSPDYIPRQYRELMEHLRPFQTHILLSSKTFDTRHIDFIYDPDGGKGKTVVKALGCLFQKGVIIPPINDAEKLVAVCCDICEKRQLRDPSPIFIDLPRAMDKKKLAGVYSAIEQIKDGHLYDLRYQYKEFWIDSPAIWVFSNIEPDTSLLSADRWRIWIIDKDFKLVPMDI